jgi:hypothetical protein
MRLWEGHLIQEMGVKLGGKEAFLQERSAATSAFITLDLDERLRSGLRRPPDEFDSEAATDLNDSRAAYSIR